MFRLWAAVILVLSVTACSVKSPMASDDRVARAQYVHSGPPTITLLTVVSTRTGGGAHSALLINGSQRVIFDPAGSFKHQNLPEQNDVVYGMTDAAVDFYIDYHARPAYYMVRQDVVVSPEVAERALNRVRAHGAVREAFCANAVSRVLTDIPGFSTISKTMFPKTLMRRFAETPGVTQEEFYDFEVEENGVMVSHGI